MARKTGGYTGVVFLTYSLNLIFFEQIITPALESAGCANILIISDPDGYSGAIEMGGKAITGAGVRYVCTPLPKLGHGVQHIKMVLMAGSRKGRLLVGSGNLTMHGFGRNLELFSSFDYENEKDDHEGIYPFRECWKLLASIWTRMDSYRSRLPIFCLRLERRRFG